jgi:hypothetical protein
MLGCVLATRRGRQIQGPASPRERVELHAHYGTNSTAWTSGSSLPDTHARIEVAADLARVVLAQRVGGRPRAGPGPGTGSPPGPARARASPHVPFDLVPLWLRETHQMPTGLALSRGKGGPAARAPPLLNHARPRSHRAALPLGGRDPGGRRGGRVPTAGQLALPGLPGAEPLPGVGVRMASRLRRCPWFTLWGSVCHRVECSAEAVRGVRPAVPQASERRVYQGRRREPNGGSPASGGASAEAAILLPFGLTPPRLRDSIATWREHHTASPASVQLVHG